MSNDSVPSNEDVPVAPLHPQAAADDLLTVAREGPADQSGSAASPVPGYEVLEELGRGGMGVVYRARQAALKREVALKMILAAGHAGSDARARFLAEAEAIAAVGHPGIVQVYEYGTHDGLPFFALEFCPGGSL